MEQEWHLVEPLPVVPGCPLYPALCQLLPLLESWPGDRVAPAWAARPGAAGAWEDGCRREQQSSASPSPRSSLQVPERRARPPHWPWLGSDLRSCSASPIPPLAQQRPLREALQDSQRRLCTHHQGIVWLPSGSWGRTQACLAPLSPACSPAEEVVQGAPTTPGQPPHPRVCVPAQALEARLVADGAPESRFWGDSVWRVERRGSRMMGQGRLYLERTPEPL